MVNTRPERYAASGAGGLNYKAESMPTACVIEIFLKIVGGAAGVSISKTSIPRDSLVMNTGEAGKKLLLQRRILIESLLADLQVQIKGHTMTR